MLHQIASGWRNLEFENEIECGQNKLGIARAAKKSTYQNTKVGGKQSVGDLGKRRQ